MLTNPREARAVVVSDEGWEHSQQMRKELGGVWGVWGWVGVGRRQRGACDVMYWTHHRDQQIAQKKRPLEDRGVLLLGAGRLRSSARHNASMAG